LEQTLSRLAGRNIRLDFAVLPDESTGSIGAESPSPRPQINRRQRQSELQRHPLIRKASELFDTEIITVLDAPTLEEAAAETGDGSV
jgi:hypothetical protein